MRPAHIFRAYSGFHVPRVTGKTQCRTPMDGQVQPRILVSFLNSLAHPGKRHARFCDNAVRPASLRPGILLARLMPALVVNGRKLVKNCVHRLASLRENKRLLLVCVDQLDILPSKSNKNHRGGGGS